MPQRAYNSNEQDASVAKAASGESGRQGAGSPPVLAGFEILNKVGQGGMGAVFRARQISMDRIVALKILPKRLAQDPVFKDRFVREARLSAKLSHINLIGGIECGESNGYTFFAMEFVEGGTTRDLLKKSGPLDIELALNVARQVAAALTYAHGKQFIHRDIKPENIMLTPDGTAKVCDLGLARSMDSADAGLTVAGLAIGTPNYLSPEQARGQHELTPATDVYSFGATFYHLLSGHPLFEAPTPPGVMAKHLTETAPAITAERDETPYEFALILSKCLAKSADERYASGAELLRDLDAAAAGKPIAAAEFRGKSSCARPAPPARTDAPRRPMPRLKPRYQGRRANNNSGMLIGLGAVAVLAIILLFGLPGNKPVVEKAPKPVPAPTPPKTIVPEPRPPVSVAPRVEHPTPVKVEAPPTGSDLKPVVPLKEGAMPLKHSLLEADPLAPGVAAAPKTETAKTETEPAQEPAKLDAPKADVIPAAVAQRALNARKDLAHLQFLNQMLKRTTRLDLAKAEKEIRDLAAKDEFAGVRDEAAGDIKDLQQSSAYELRTLAKMGAAKGALTLPSDHPLRKFGDKIVVQEFDPARGLVVTVSGARMPLTGNAIPPRTIVEASGVLAGGEPANYYFYRGDQTIAQKLVSSMAEADRARLETRLNLLKTGETELNARCAYADLIELSRTKQWKPFLEKAAAFEKAYADTPTGQTKLPELAAVREFAGDLLNPYKSFNAKSVTLLGDGFVELTYDWQTPQQLKMFACDHGELTAKDGVLRVPEGGDEWSSARFTIPIAELRHLEINGKSLGDSTRLGICALPTNRMESAINAPRCICRSYNRMAHLEVWEPPFVKARTNAIGTQEVNWSKELNFTVDATGEIWKWTVGGGELPPVKLPVMRSGFQLMFFCPDGNHVWSGFRVVFKPTSAWQKEALPPLPAPKDLKKDDKLKK